MAEGRRSIAIIGAGSAGTTAAYKLWREFGDSLDIAVYERGKHAGGRAWDIHFAGERIEVGGSVLHSSGRHIMELMEFAGAKEGVSGLSIDGKDETYGFWTSAGFPVFTHTTLASMALGIVKHVGPYAALKVTNEAVDMAAKWEGVYELQDAGTRFERPDDLLKALDLHEPTTISLGEFLQQRYVGKRMAEDIVEAITHNMYNQGLEMNAFAGLVGLAGAGLAGGYLFAVDGGNWTVFQKTLERMGAPVRFEVGVKRIEAFTARDGARTFAVEADDGTRDLYDAVIVAAPFALSGIEVLSDGVKLDIPAHPYQRVECTFIAGDINPRYFGGKAKGRVPSTAYTATSAGAPFMSIGITGFSSNYGKRIYKIFSADHVMTDAEIAPIFERIGDVRRFTWPGAYPVLTPGIEHVPFVLAPGLYYGCAFETAAGSIEVEAVGGTNAAALAADYLHSLEAQGGRV